MLAISDEWTGLRSIAVSRKFALRRVRYAVSASPAGTKQWHRSFLCDMPVSYHWMVAFLSIRGSPPRMLGLASSANQVCCDKALACDRKRHRRKCQRSSARHPRYRIDTRHFRRVNPRRSVATALPFPPVAGCPGFIGASLSGLVRKAMRSAFLADRLPPD